MKVVDSISTLRHTVNAWRRNGESVGFVPTMGNLHDGHLKLVKKAKAHNDNVVVSIFVNPLQFSENEDFEKYPRDLKRDAKLASDSGADAIWAPTVSEVFPGGEDYHFKIQTFGSIVKYIVHAIVILYWNSRNLAS